MTEIFTNCVIGLPEELIRKDFICDPNTYISLSPDEQPYYFELWFLSTRMQIDLSHFKNDLVTSNKISTLLQNHLKKAIKLADDTKLGKIDYTSYLKSLPEEYHEGVGKVLILILEFMEWIEVLKDLVLNTQTYYQSEKYIKQDYFVFDLFNYAMNINDRILLSFVEIQDMYAKANFKNQELAEFMGLTAEFNNLIFAIMNLGFETPKKMFNIVNNVYSSSNDQYNMMVVTYHKFKQNDYYLMKNFAYVLSRSRLGVLNKIA